MLISDHIAKCLAEHNINNIFVFQGGSCSRLIDSISCNKDLQFFCNLHEQASSMAADAMTRLTGKLSVVVVTSGPGATNLVTGCAGAWFDSVPVLFITGQVATQYLKNDKAIRQNGFQETDVLPIFSEITKYSVRLTEPEKVLYELDKAIDIAMSGRKGPVLIDIPEDIQRMEFPETLFLRYNKKEKVTDCTDDILVFRKMLEKAKKPVFVVGQGVHCALAEQEMVHCIEKFEIPTIFTYAAMDLLSSDHCLNFGNLGINGHVYANAIIQNSDLLVFFGTRLDHHLTGKNLDVFAPNATKILIEIDQGEIEKFQNSKCCINHSILADMKLVLCEMNSWEWKTATWKQWVDKCTNAKTQMKGYDQRIPAHYFEIISNVAPQNAIIVFDTGSSLLWGMHYFKFKNEQRCISEFNHTSMGYALPAAIGAALACPDRTVFCISGDGGLQLNIQELATVQKNCLNIKIIVFDNSAYALMLGAQNTHMSGRHAASTINDGLPLPVLEGVFEGYGIPSVVVDENISESKIQDIISHKGAAALIFRLSPDILVENQIGIGKALSEEIL